MLLAMRSQRVAFGWQLAQVQRLVEQLGGHPLVSTDFPSLPLAVTPTERRMNAGEDSTEQEGQVSATRPRKTALAISGHGSGDGEQKPQERQLVSCSTWAAVAGRDTHTDTERQEDMPATTATPEELTAASDESAGKPITEPQQHACGGILGRASGCTCAGCESKTSVGVSSPKGRDKDGSIAVSGPDFDFQLLSSARSRTTGSRAVHSCHSDNRCTKVEDRSTVSLCADALPPLCPLRLIQYRRHSASIRKGSDELQSLHTRIQRIRAVASGVHFEDAYEVLANGNRTQSEPSESGTAEVQGDMESPCSRASTLRSIKHVRQSLSEEIPLSLAGQAWCTDSEGTKADRGPLGVDDLAVSMRLGNGSPKHLGCAGREYPGGQLAGTWERAPLSPSTRVEAVGKSLRTRVTYESSENEGGMQTAGETREYLLKQQRERQQLLREELEKSRGELARIEHLRHLQAKTRLLKPAREPLQIQTTLQVKTPRSSDVNGNNGRARSQGGCSASASTMPLSLTHSRPRCHGNQDLALREEFKVTETSISVPTDEPSIRPLSRRCLHSPSERYPPLPQDDIPTPSHSPPPPVCHPRTCAFQDMLMDWRSFGRDAAGVWMNARLHDSRTGCEHCTYQRNKSGIAKNLVCQLCGQGAQVAAHADNLLVDGAACDVHTSASGQGGHKYGKGRYRGESSQSPRHSRDPDRNLGCEEGRFIGQCSRVMTGVPRSWMIRLHDAVEPFAARRLVTPRVSITAKPAARWAESISPNNAASSASSTASSRDQARRVPRKASRTPHVSRQQLAVPGTTMGPTKNLPIHDTAARLFRADADTVASLLWAKSLRTDDGLRGTGSSRSRLKESTTGGAASSSTMRPPTIPQSKQRNWNSPTPSAQGSRLIGSPATLHKLRFHSACSAFEKAFASNSRVRVCSDGPHGALPDRPNTAAQAEATAAHAYNVRDSHPGARLSTEDMPMKPIEVKLKIHVPQEKASCLRPICPLTVRRLDPATHRMFFPKGQRYLNTFSAEVPDDHSVAAVVSEGDTPVAVIRVRVTADAPDRPL
ncbi:hypothetical protein BESB_030720 [Besnoitia besnoiti]|uniref:Uncharacterized protein n=1 Tax=Besnoitia besnoiti TaxID=94643 RepID=A0A2A9LXI8_BESBE|nr:hypothetical protein BESB_030720 [Besnoitia besnoiti]PFH31198.1 hypothetical protein BESB_030720 [Besnoitia besnoiti]